VNGLLNIVPAVAAKVMGRPLLWQLIGDHYPRAVVDVLRPIVTWLADEIAFEAKQMKRFYFGDKSFDYTILHEPVDLERFHGNDQNKAHLRAEFGLESSQPVIGSVGNISPAKGWEYFLDAIHALVEDIPELHALIIGAVSETQKEYAEKIRKRVRTLGLEDHVTMTGYRTDVEELLQIVDIFMMASVNEGTPLAILEAMGTGLPVIATDVGGVAEEVNHEETGYICPPRDAGALARSCRHLLENPRRRKEMGKAGRRRAAEHFSLASSVEDHVCIYQNMAEDAGLLS
jgi:glycosyltransferase involved in cell wall biosynthesis